MNTQTQNPSPPQYAAAQIARALGVTTGAVRLRLRGIPQSGIVTRRGQAAQTWTGAAFPQALRNELADAAGRRGFAGIEGLLADPPAQWTPPVSWHAIAATHRKNAEQLCAALAPALARQHELSGPDLMDLARVGYRQHFGHEIEPAKLRYVMDRATRRDNNLNQFERPDLYLDDAAFHQAPAAQIESGELHGDMAAHVAGVIDKAEPSLADRKHLFLAAFRHLEKLAAEHPSKGERRAAKNSLVEHLLRAVPGLYRPQAAARSADAGKPLLALRRQFNQKYSAWITGAHKPESLDDNRASNSGRKGYCCPRCEKIIRAIASRFRGPDVKGNVSLAIKLTCEKKQLCPACLVKFRARHVSTAILARVTPNAFEIAAHKGADAIRKIAPTHHNDWSDTEPGDRFVIDDMTTNEIAWDEINGEIISGQAQLLYTEDERSAMPLPYRLYFGAPNSITIKQAVRLVLANAGLPHVGLYTERGVFNNRQLSGERNARHLLPIREMLAALDGRIEFRALDDDELKRVRGFELGLRDPAFGLRISQARNPQGKTVERSFYELQKRASILPGFGGFNQRFEKSRAMQDFDRRVSIGKEHPGNEYLHLSELRKNYDLICTEFSERPINGTRHRGRTPADMWNEAVNRRPLRKLPEEMEHLMATHHLPAIKVQTTGIKISLDRYEDAFYFGAAAGPLVGQRVAVRIDYDFPGFIHIEHPDTGAFLKVDRAYTKRRTATREEIAKVSAARREHIKGALGESGNVDLMLKSYVLRDSRYTPGDLAKGRAIGEAKEQDKQAQASAAREQRHLEKLAGTLGATVPAKPRNRARQAEALEALKDGKQQLDALENPTIEKGNHK